MYQKRNFGVMPRTFTGMLDEMLHTGINRFNEEVNAFSAPVNIKETDHSYEMDLVAPGIRKEDIKLTVEKNLLHISYDHSEESKDEQEHKWLRSEYRHRSFKRSFSLNEKIDAGKISAKYENGILHISLAKKENAEVVTKEIAVN